MNTSELAVTEQGTDYKTPESTTQALKQLARFGTYEQYKAASDLVRLFYATVEFDEVNHHATFTVTVPVQKPVARTKQHREAAKIFNDSIEQLLSYSGYERSTKCNKVKTVWCLYNTLCRDMNAIGLVHGCKNLEGLIKTQSEQTISARKQDKRLARVYNEELVREAIERAVIGYHYYGHTVSRESLSEGWKRSGKWSHYLDGDSLECTFGETGEAGLIRLDGRPLTVKLWR